MNPAQDQAQEHEGPSFQPDGGLRRLVDTVAFRSALDADPEPGGGAARGIGLVFRSRTLGDHEYQLVLDEADARKLVEELGPIVGRQDPGDDETGGGEPLPQQANPEG